MPVPTLHTPAIPVISVDTTGNPLNLAANGDPSVGISPKLIAGTDSAGVVRIIRTNSAGQVQTADGAKIVVSGPFAQPAINAIGGTVYANNPDGSSVGVTASGSYGFDASSNQWRPRAGDASGNQTIVGSVASGTADSGNPVKVGAQYVSTTPVFTTGQRTDLQASANGSLYVDFGRNGNNKSPTADAQASVTGLNAYSQNMYFNGTAWDRQKGDITGAWSHAPANTTSTTLSGTIAAAGATATVPFTNTTRQEVINPSAAVLWASWAATPAVNGAGSFQIAPGGTYSTDRTAGTLTLLSTVATQTYTVNRFS